jgi:hypothetical protein
MVPDFCTCFERLFGVQLLVALVLIFDLINLVGAFGLRHDLVSVSCKGTVPDFCTCLLG